MEKEKNDLSERLLDFAAEIIKLAVQLNRSAVGRHISGQLIPSSTSAGETLYWLRLIKKSKLVSSATLEVLIQEAKELANIIAKSIVTAKKK